MVDHLRDNNTDISNSSSNRNRDSNNSSTSNMECLKDGRMVETRLGSPHHHQVRWM